MHKTVTVTNFYCDACGKVCEKEEIVQIVLPTTGKDEFVATYCAMPFCNVELCASCAEKVIKFVQSLNIDFQGIVQEQNKAEVNKITIDVSQYAECAEEMQRGRRRSFLYDD